MYVLYRQNQDKSYFPGGWKIRYLHLTERHLEKKKHGLMTLNHDAKCHVETRMEPHHKHTKLGTNYMMASCAEVEEMTQRIHKYGYSKKKKIKRLREENHLFAEIWCAKSEVVKSSAHLRPLVQMK